MGVLSNLEPKKVFEYFEEITKIPHGSGNVEQISDYLVQFAKDRGLKYIQDECKNVILFQDATPGYEEEPTIILQGHMDMVAVQKPDCKMDMKTEGLRVAIDGDKIYAEGTSLGGDDGIAVAYSLALLDSPEVCHPALEVIITVDEEVGMDGARAIDLSMLKGHTMINLDSEDEGIFLTSCAGGARINCHLPLERKTQEGILCKIEMGGLLGGHSGGEIHKERGNSNCLMARILRELSAKYSFALVTVQGGLADNAIPRVTEAEILLTDTVEAAQLKAGVEAELAKIAAQIKDELSTKDPNASVTWSIATEKTGHFAVSEIATKKVLAALVALPNGVLAMSADMPGLVQTSLNLGIMEAKESELIATFAVRSSIESEKYALLEKVKSVIELAGGSYSITGDYPGWKYRKDSPLRNKMARIYKEMYGKEAKLEAIHAGLECGILGSKISDLDCIALGPDMTDIHTTEETLSISSTARVWEFLVEVLQQKGM